MKKTLLASILGLALSASAFALPSVKIIATGGTIAGAASSATNTTGYDSAKVGVAQLIEAVPQMKDYAEVSGEQIAKISSNNMDTPTLLKLAKRVNALAADPKVDGIVITHGTDTIEETAYFLNLTVKTDKPVVLVGAMRPSTALSADGPMNLLEAVQTAASPKMKGQGVVIVMNDQISAARETTKCNTTNVSTFAAPEIGYLGYVLNNEPVLYRTSTRRHTTKSEFDVSNGRPFRSCPRGRRHQVACSVRERRLCFRRQFESAEGPPPSAARADEDHGSEGNPEDLQRILTFAQENRPQTPPVLFRPPIFRGTSGIQKFKLAGANIE